MLCTRKRDRRLRHSLAPALVLACAGWLVSVGGRSSCNGQQPQADLKMFEKIRAAAEKGDASEQYMLAQIYEFGSLGVRQDPAKALEWYRKAAERGLVMAQVNVATHYQEGIGVAKDLREAYRWYRKAAEQGDAWGQWGVGLYYAAGWGVGRNYTEAVAWMRKAAEQGHFYHQWCLGNTYDDRDNVGTDPTEAVKWWRKAAEQGYREAEFKVGECYYRGDVVAMDAAEAVKWWRKAAEQNDAIAQCNLGTCYAYGQGMPKDYVEAVKWYRKAAEQNFAGAQVTLGCCYMRGDGVTKDYVEAYKWTLLAAAQGNEKSKEGVTILERVMTSEQIAEGQRLAREFKPHQISSPRGDGGDVGALRPEVSGTGFFISEDGYLVTNEHVVKGGNQVRLVTSAGLLTAKVVKLDTANDLAILKTEGKFAALPVASSRGVRLGATVSTVGFPNIGLQGFAPKLAKGEIAGLAGAQDDPRHFQISAPIQPGNSGGALVDERGSVIGVVVAKLSQKAALATSGQLAENVSYAVKSSFLLSFLESLPQVAAKLQEPKPRQRQFEDVVNQAQEATALVLVY